MQAKLIFDLPEEKEEFTLVLRGQDLWSVLFEMDQWLRGQLKYGHTYFSADEALEVTRNRLNYIMDEHGISIDMVS